MRTCWGCVKAWLLYACQIFCHSFLSAALLLCMQNLKGREDKYSKVMKSEGCGVGRVMYQAVSAFGGRCEHVSCFWSTRAMTWFMGFLGDLEPQRKCSVDWYCMCGRERFRVWILVLRNTDIDLRISSKMRLVPDRQKLFWLHPYHLFSFSM